MTSPSSPAPSTRKRGSPCAVTSQWGVKSGKEIEKLHPAIAFLKERTLYEGFRSRWGLFGLLSVIPWWNKNCNDKIACLHFSAR